MTVKQVKIKLACPNCGWADIRTNRNGARFCRRCGWCGKPEEFVVKKEGRNGEVLDALG